MIGTGILNNLVLGPDSLATLLQVTTEIEEMRFNTGISAMMEFINGVTKVGGHLVDSRVSWWLCMH